MTELWDRVQAAARGLAGLGVCDVAPWPDVAGDMRERKGAGTAATLSFTYTDPSTATDVTRSFPWAERLVVGAWSYAGAAGSPGPPRPGTGRIARFATEDHYRGLREALDSVTALLRDEGWQAAVLIDDNRLVDRAAAVRAGVGWWGKNSMVLAPRHGPWLLLGSVATDAPLPTTAPMRRDCGSCSACLPACPTGALVAPGILDASKCLAYWAQTAGPIPVEYREPMGDRVYGCDDCLDACPPGAKLVAEHVSSVRGRVDLISLLASADRDLLDRYAHFYVPRRRARYLRRNALVALGNAGGGEAVSIAAGYLGHPDPLLRLHAAWALGRLGGTASIAALRAAAGKESDDAVLAEIKDALATADMN